MATWGCRYKLRTPANMPIFDACEFSVKVAIKKVNLKKKNSFFLRFWFLSWQSQFASSSFLTLLLSCGEKWDATIAVFVPRFHRFLLYLFFHLPLFLSPHSLKLSVVSYPPISALMKFPECWSKTLGLCLVRKDTGKRGCHRALWGAAQGDDCCCLSSAFFFFFFKCLLFEVLHSRGASPLIQQSMFDPWCGNMVDFLL